ncbi:MAG TPA: AIR synthase related protein [bacterium]|nr:AIR synthase related protein [bacterium]
MSYQNDVFDFVGMNEPEFTKVKKENGWGLTISEFRQAQKRAKKPLTLTETYILDSLWSDHCSYKHSKHKLKSLIRDNRYVLKSEKSDAGAVRIGNSNYYAVFKIESHNHPTLINPFDGAATGVGGILRDIFAMGAKNIGVGASLRYGPKESPASKDVLKGAMEGAASYCKAIDIPLIALDLYHEESFKHNCLMNVSALGIVKKENLIPNTVSKNAVGYNLVYIGKPTAGAAVGGASFASQAFEEGKTKEIEFGSNPMLEKATFDAFEKVKKALISRKLLSQISLKDMGAAGLTCSTAEQVSERGYGIEILTEKVPVPAGMKVHPLALAVGEDQERNMIIASEKATKVILDVMKKEKAFKKYGGRVAVIGKVTGEDRFVMRDKNTVYCDIPLSLITEAPVYRPSGKKLAQKGKSFSAEKPKSLKEEILRVVSSINTYSRQDIFDVLKLEKTGFLFTKPEETDVCVIAPLKKEKNNRKAGIALVFGGKSLHGRNGTSAEQAYIATVLARLKLAAAGLKPVAAADGCNYGNPDNPEHYHSFSAGIDGLNKACRIPLYGEKQPLAVVAGNVSLKNTFISKGKEEPVDPSMVPVVFGYIPDYEKTVTTGLKKDGSILFLAGKRKHEFKGSEYAALNKQEGRNLPSVSPDQAGKLEYAALEASGKGLLLSSAVIENGGLAAALTRMAALGKKNAGVKLDMDFAGKMREDYALFTESAGYVIEADKKSAKELQKIYKKYGIELVNIGVTTREKSFSGTLKGRKVFEIPLEELTKSWSRK